MLWLNLRNEFHVNSLSVFQTPVELARLLRVGWCNSDGILRSEPGVQSAKKSANAISKAQFKEVVSKAVDYLRVSGQSSDGSFSKQQTLGVTSLVAAGLLSVDVPREDPVVAKALAFIEKAIRPDGGI